jgi:hypothetical protein
VPGFRKKEGERAAKLYGELANHRLARIKGLGITAGAFRAF